MDAVPWSSPRLPSSKENLMFQQFRSQFHAGIRISGDGTVSFIHSLTVAQKLGTCQPAPHSGPSVKAFTGPRSICEMEMLLVPCNCLLSGSNWWWKSKVCSNGWFLTLCVGKKVLLKASCTQQVLCKYLPRSSSSHVWVLQSLFSDQSAAKWNHKGLSCNLLQLSCKVGSLSFQVFVSSF